MLDIVLIAHNVRSSHNVGSLLRTAEGLGVAKVYLSSYTPYPTLDKDDRLPHIANKVHAQISKTALGAEKLVQIEHTNDISQLLSGLRQQGYYICALEQAPGATPLPTYKPQGAIALIVGNELEGIEPELLGLADTVLEIPMYGKKESFNVAQAAAMALFHLRFGS